MTHTGSDVHSADDLERLRSALGEGYELGELLGRGGFAAVYAARDRRLNRDVAIKVLRAELDAPVFRERFRREAESIARLRHPNIMPIYAIGDAGELAYFIMPRIVGESLQAQIAREKRLAIPDARRILDAAAAALGAAHRSGLVHRDIKPDNIMLDGEERHVLLTDFGIAKALGGDTEAGLTGSGMLVGTPHYMAPEQIAGDGTVDHRADLYALGVVAYQMLTGRAPFEGPNVASLLLRQLSEEPQPLSTLRPDCPPAFADAVMRCLAKRPEDRWPSADSFRQAIAQENVAAPVVSSETAGRVPTVATESPSPANEIRAYRMLAIGTAITAIVLVALDMRDGALGLSPLAIPVGAMFVGIRFLPLWRAGYSWSDVIPGLARTPSPVPVSAKVTTSTGIGASTPGTPARSSGGTGGGSYSPADDPAVNQARSDRATIVSLLAKLSRSERSMFPDPVPAVNAAVAEVAELSRRRRQRHSAELLGTSAITQRLAEVRREPASAGRDHRIRLLEQQLARAQEAGDVRSKSDARIEEAGAMLRDLRFALERRVAGEDTDIADLQAAIDAMVTSTGATR